MAEITPSLDELPKVEPDLKSELENYKHDGLNKVEVVEKVVLPDQEDIQTEKTQQAILKGVECFDKTELKHTDTEVKVVLPDQEDIATEKTQQALLKGVEGFDKKNLQHADTKESNSLPTKEGKPFLNYYSNYFNTSIPTGATSFPAKYQTNLHFVSHSYRSGEASLKYSIQSER